MADEWDEYADGWDDDPGARAYAAAAFTSLQDELGARDMSLDGLRVLDFGCGTGLLTERMVASVASIDAVDSSPAMLDVLDAKIEQRQWAQVTPARTIRAGRATHDLVVCSSVCSFLDDYPGTVVKLADLLRPGGLFVQWDWERDDNDADPHGLSRAEIAAALTAAGLTDIDARVAFEVRFGDQVMRPLIGAGRVAAS